MVVRYLRKLVCLSLMFLCGVTYAKVYNFAKVSENLYRGGWLSNGKKDFQVLKEHGVDTIINLAFMRSESKKLCAKYKMNCKRSSIYLLPFVNYYYIDSMKRAYKKVLEQLDAGKTVYVHCMFGSDRTGAIISALKVRKEICGQKNPDRRKVKEEIEKSLSRHSFHRASFYFLRTEILSWVDSPPDWICQPKKELVSNASKTDAA